MKSEVEMSVNVSNIARYGIDEWRARFEKRKYTFNMQ